MLKNDCFTSPDRQDLTRLNAAMSAAPPPKVLIATLWQRRSARGNEYLSGFLGKARIIGFRGEPTPEGIPTWNIFLQPGKEQEKAEAERKPASSRPAISEQPRQQQRQQQPDLNRPFFSDEIDDVGRDG
jgi:hypothetical protein